jgi:hypothetical protein
MSPIYLHNGALLVEGGALATSSNCCCDKCRNSISGESGQCKVQVSIQGETGFSPFDFFSPSWWWTIPVFRGADCECGGGCEWTSGQAIADWTDGWVFDGPSYLISVGANLICSESGKFIVEATSTCMYESEETGNTTVAQWVGEVDSLDGYPNGTVTFGDPIIFPGVASGVQCTPPTPEIVFTVQE